MSEYERHGVEGVDPTSLKVRPPGSFFQLPLPDLQPHSAPILPTLVLTTPPPAAPIPHLPDLCHRQPPWASCSGAERISGSEQARVCLPKTPVNLTLLTQDHCLRQPGFHTCHCLTTTILLSESPWWPHTFLTTLSPCHPGA